MVAPVTGGARRYTDDSIGSQPIDCRSISDHCRVMPPIYSIYLFLAKIVLSARASTIDSIVGLASGLLLNPANQLI